MMNIRATKLSLNLPFGLGGIVIEPNEAEQRAAWTLYVELMTRVAVQPLDPETGLLREALKSLYSLFELTRKILLEAGPEVAHGPESLGPVAIEVLNKGLRPFTAKWHPRLLDYETQRPAEMSQLEHERQWQYYDDMRQELAEVQEKMRGYAEGLAKIAGAK
jgi:hypothetical protein